MASAKKVIKSVLAGNIVRLVEGISLGFAGITLLVAGLVAATFNQTWLYLCFIGVLYIAIAIVTAKQEVAGIIRRVQ